jgi:hypothetical protein
MLAHFLPFSAKKPNSLIDGSLQATFDTSDFTPWSLEVMKNWDAIHECEDERDAEHIWKKESAIKKT